MPPLLISPFNFLEQIPELRDLPKSDLNYLLSKSSIIELKDQETVFQQGTKSEYLYYVIEGKISMGNCSQAGRESANCIASRRDLFCCLPALDMAPYPVTSVSVGPAKAIRIPILTFQEVCLRHPAIYQKFVIRVCANLREIEKRHGQRMDPVFSRIASLLLSLNEKSSHPIRLTRAEIAKLVGITIETAIRTLSQMNKDKIIQSTRGVIKIIDKGKLIEAAAIASTDFQEVSFGNSCE